MQRCGTARVWINGKVITLAATEQIDLDWLKQNKDYAKMRAVVPNNLNRHFEALGCFQVKIDQLGGLQLPAFWAIVRYLGESGWDLVAGDATSFIFKRSIEPAKPTSWQA